MTPLRTQLATLKAAAPGADPIDLAASGWFYEVASYEEIDAVEQAFAQKFRVVRPEFIEILGEPKWILPGDRKWFDQWWPETLEAAAWESDDRILCLAVEHQDKETPVILTVRCLTKAEWTDLTS